MTLWENDVALNCTGGVQHKGLAIFLLFIRIKQCQMAIMTKFLVEIYY